MSDLDLNLRSEVGRQLQSELSGAIGASPAEPTTLLQTAKRDFVYAEVWSRPGLDRRSRFFIAVASAVCAGASDNSLDFYLRGALALGEIKLNEWREAALQLAAYAGWSAAEKLDAAITRVAIELNLMPAAIEPLQTKPRSAQERVSIGQEKFKRIAIVQPPPAITPYFESGILNFAFAEVWTRAGLDQRGRRWITLACVANSTATTPMRAHTYAAMASGDATLPEMQEFVLQFAADAGLPKAAALQIVVMEMSDRVAKNLPFE